MRLLKRIAEIVSANMTDQDAREEDPGPSLEQAVNDMDASIDAARKAAATALASEKVLAGRIAEHARGAESWGRRAEEAVDQGNDDDARAALTQKKEHLERSAALSDEHAVARDHSRRMRRRLETMLVRRDEARRSVATIETRHCAARARQEVMAPNLDATPFDKFDRMTEKVEMAEAEADAMRELSGATAPPAESPAVQGDHDADVEAELARLKRAAAG